MDIIELDMQPQDKVAVVTGANKGLGLAIVGGLCAAKFPGRVYLTSRDTAKGHEAVAALNMLGLRPWYHQLDVTDEASVQRFRDYLATTHGGVDVLVNNAAVNFRISSSSKTYGDLAAQTIRVNYEGAVLVTNSLWPLLREGARVVHVCSTAGHVSRICGHEPHASVLRAHFTSDQLTQEHLNRLMREYVQAARSRRFLKLGWPESAYAVSKVGIAALTRVQQRQFDKERRDVIVNCVHPGFLDTALSLHRGKLTTQQGARLPVQLCLLPEEATSPRGQFVWSDGSHLDWTSGCTPQHPFRRPRDLVKLDWTI